MGADTHVLVLQQEVYRLTAVKKAAYKFASRCGIQVHVRDSGHTEVRLTPAGAGDLEQLLREFQQELIDQEVRELVRGETEGLRNLILAQAFSPISLLCPEADTDDHRRDPLGIAIGDRKA